MSLRVLALLLAGSASTVLAASGSGSSTRYWDCCKPSCAWSGKANVLQGPVRSCDKNDNPVDASVKSGCDNGSAYTCSNNSPWAVNDQVAFGFAATHISGGNEASWCCACYKLTFTSGPVAGKTMVVQSTNTGGDLSGNQFDLQMPGGGVGIFDGCASQFGQSLPGERYGGISSRSQCDSFPQSLKDGCYWRFDWFKNADNPSHTFEQVQCPSELVAISGCRRADDSSFPAFQMPSNPTTSTPPGNGGGSSASTKPPTTTTSPPSSGGAAQWAQCGGIGWTGPTSCVSPYTCTKLNDWYYQCL